jgi:hypothetical protein
VFSENAFSLRFHVLSFPWSKQRNCCLENWHSPIVS